VMLLSNGIKLAILFDLLYFLLAPSDHIPHLVNRPEILWMPIVSCLARKLGRSSRASNHIECINPVTDGRPTQKGALMV
jgi:hypothetical protein